MFERRAKIVATIGPSSQDEAVLARLMQAGMEVARLNFSHGTHVQHEAAIAKIRKVSKELDKPVAILQDLQGPKLRVGELPKEGVKLTSGDKLVLAPVPLPDQIKSLSADAIVIPMEVPNLIGSVKVGNRILLDDGQMELVVAQVGENYLEATVVLGGVLQSHKGVNLPGASLDIPAFTEKDRADLEFGLQHQVDAVAISFVRTADNIAQVRKHIQQMAPELASTPIIAKLERPEAISHLEEIVAAADGVMVARGDLAVETSPAEVPIIQKKIIEAANRQAKLVITATQMLNSMISNPRPTRAEASDVANAILDGTDAVMLSGETASGEYPIESVVMMDAIVREAEHHLDKWGHCQKIPDEPTSDDAVSLARAARELAHDRNVAAVAVFTQSGRTARLMSKVRPRAPILAFTPEERTYYRLCLYHGVTPFLISFASTVETMLKHVEEGLLATGQFQAGQQVILISGFPVGAMRPPNFALLHTLGEPL